MMTAPPLPVQLEQERRERLVSEFIRRFGSPPALMARAPGRVDLMGSHTDYNEGWVLTMTIDRDTWVAARPRADRLLRMESLNVEEPLTLSLDAEHGEARSWWAGYPAGVAWALEEAGARLTGADLLVHSTVPLAGGLSSSAALETAVSVAFEQMNGLQLDPVRRALLCQRAENHYVGVSCGILDQFTSSAGEEGCALLLDCRANRGTPVPMAAGIQVVICDTRAKRTLATSQYGMRRAQCAEAASLLATQMPGVRTLRDIARADFDLHASMLPETVARRARFIVEENARVLQMAEALELGDCAAIAELTAASFVGARDLYEITVPEMEQMIEAMLAAPGVIGARQAGAGFGGCMVAFVRADAVGAFAVAVAERYSARTGLAPTIYPVLPSAGAGVAPI